MTGTLRGTWHRGRFYPYIGPPRHSEPTPRSPLRPRPDRELMREYLRQIEQERSRERFKDELSNFPEDPKDLVPELPDLPPPKPPGADDLPFPWDNDRSRWSCY